MGDFFASVMDVLSHPAFVALSATVVNALAVWLGIRWLFGCQKACSSSLEPARRPILEVIEETRKGSSTSDLITHLNLPRPPLFLTGTVLKLLFSRFGKWFFGPYYLQTAFVNKFQGQFIPETATFQPTIVPTGEEKGQDEETRRSIVEELSLKRMGEGKAVPFHFRTVAEYREAYRVGSLSPVDVAKALLDAIEKSDQAKPPLRAFTQLDRSIVMAAAEVSARRWREGKPLSFMDGVPVAIKEEFKWEPFDYYCGAAFKPSIPDQLPSSRLGKKLEAAGAVVLGLTNMSEFGASPIGTNYNALHGTPTNPYRTACYTGGSSSGSAAAVAAGLCPLTLGSDGGGSVRIPSAFCGVVGIKPTFGRLADPGKKQHTHTVGHAGLLGSSVADVLVGYNCVAGKDRDVPESLVQPPLTLWGAESTDLAGLRIGFDRDYLMVSAGEVGSACLRLLEEDLPRSEAEVREVRIAELEWARLAHFTSIASEMSTGLAPEVDSHMHEMNNDSLVVIAGGLHVPASHYINAQRQRTRTIKVLEEIFKEVDCIITPATPTPAPRILPTDHLYGCTDVNLVIQSMTYVFLGNLTGIPCIVVPVGYSSEGLPLSVQVMGRWWEEHVIFRVAMAIERIVESRGGLRKPDVFYDVLPQH